MYGSWSRYAKREGCTEMVILRRQIRSRLLEGRILVGLAVAHVMLKIRLPAVPGTI